MNLKQLRNFVAVAEYKSISEAALRLSMVQPALSRYITQLEKELNTSLFHRHGRGVSLTEAGKKLLIHSEAVLEHIEQARQEILELDQTPRDTTIIGVPPSVGSLLTVPLAIQFRKQFPEAHLKIEQAYSGVVIEWLASGQIDAAVLYKNPHTNNIKGDKLEDEELYLIAPKENRVIRGPEVEAAYLGDVPLVLPPNPHGLRLLLDQKSQQDNFQLNIVMEVSGLEATKALVREAGLYTVLPYAPVHRDVQAGELAVARIIKPEMSRTMLLTTSTRKPLSKTTRAVVKLIRELVPELYRSGQWKHGPL